MPPRQRLTRLELELMEVIWQLGEATVRQVRDALPEERRVAYTTVLTVVSRLEEKGALVRRGKVSNAVVYAPTLERQAVHGRLIGDLLAHLAPQRLVSYLVAEGHMSLQELRELEAALQLEEDQRAVAGEATAGGEVGEEEGDR